MKMPLAPFFVLKNFTRFLTLSIFPRTDRYTRYQSHLHNAIYGEILWCLLQNQQALRYNIME